MAVSFVRRDRVLPRAGYADTRAMSTARAATWPNAACCAAVFRRSRAASAPHPAAGVPGRVSAWTIPPLGVNSGLSHDRHTW